MLKINFTITNIGLFFSLVKALQIKIGKLEQLITVILSILKMKIKDWILFCIHETFVKISRISVYENPTFVFHVTNKKLFVKDYYTRLKLLQYSLEYFKHFGFCYCRQYKLFCVIKFLVSILERYMYIKYCVRQL